MWRFSALFTLGGVHVFPCFEPQACHGLSSPTLQVQQDLASPGVVERFVKSPEDAAEIRLHFAGMSESSRCFICLCVPPPLPAAHPSQALPQPLACHLHLRALEPGQPRGSGNRRSD